MNKDDFAIKTQATIWQGADLVVMARIQDVAGVNITKASIASIVLRGYNKNLAAPEVAVFSDLGIDVNVTVFDTLVTTDPLWPSSVDTIGYNFKYTIAGANFNAATEWRLVFTITPATGTAMPLVAEATTDSCF